MAKKDLVVNIDSKTKGLEQGMSKSVNEVRKLEKQTQKSKNEFKQFDDRIGKLASGNLSGLLGTMGSVAGAVAVAKLAQEGFNKTLKSSQATSDAFDLAIGQAKGGVDYFFQSIATGDFSNFMKGLDDAIRRGGELTLVLDELGDRLAGWDDVSSDLTTQIAENRAKIQDERTTPEEREQLLKKQSILINKLKTTAEIVNEKQNEVIRKTVQSIANIDNVTMEEVTEYLQKTSMGINKELDTYIEKYEKLKRKSEEVIETQMTIGDSVVRSERETPAATQAKAELEILKQKNPLLERQYEISKLVMDLERKGLVTSRQQMRARSVMISNMERQLSRDKRRKYDTLDDFDGGMGGTQEKGLFGSISHIDEKIKNLNKKISISIDDEDRKALNKELNELEREKRIITFVYQYEGDFDPNEKIDKQSTSATVTMGASKPITLPIVNDVSEQISSMELWNNTMSKVMEDNWASIESFNGIAMAMSAIGNISDDATAQMIQWGASVLSTIGQAIPAIMALIAVKEVEANANAKVAVTGAAASVAGIPIVGGILALAAIASVVAAMASIPKFAEGGLVYGNTIAQVGEYAGASNNPEVIAPLSKLRDILSDTQQGGIGGVVDFRITGKDLVGTLNNYSSKQNKK